MSDKPKPYEARLTVEHSCLPNGDIVSRTLMHDPCESTVDVVNRHVLSTKDAAVRKSLIALGWTPPGGLDSCSKELIALGWTPPGELPGRRVVAGPGLTGGGPDPREVRAPIGSSYPVAYRLVAFGDGDGRDVIHLEGLHIIDGRRRWVSLPTQKSLLSEDFIPSFLPV